MNIFKKLLSFLLCGTLIVSASFCTTANAAPNLSVSDAVSSLVDNNKTGYYTSTRCIFDTTISNSGVTEAVYDIYGKVDVVKADPNNFQKIDTKLPETITKVTARMKKDNGAYVYARVLSFEPGQVGHARLAFPVNGKYEVVVYASTGTNVDFEVNVTKASGYGSINDRTPPELNITVPDKSQYVPGKKITIKVSTNEICNISVGGLFFSQCNYATFTVSKNGLYKVTATDMNDNPTTKTFTIDYAINNQSSDTTSKPVTTTTTQKPTTTTSTTKTTTTRTTTTTTRTTTTTIYTTTTTTTEPVTTTTTKPPVWNISVKPPTKTKYYVGESLDLSGGTASIYSNYDQYRAYDEPLTSDSFVIDSSRFNPEKAGGYLIYIYDAADDSVYTYFYVTVEEAPTTATTTVTTTATTTTEPVTTTTTKPPVWNISVKPPTKTKYYVGESLDLSGGTASIYSNYDQYRAYDEPLTSDSFVIDSSRFNPEKAGGYLIYVYDAADDSVYTYFYVTVEEAPTTATTTVTTTTTTTTVPPTTTTTTKPITDKYDIVLPDESELYVGNTVKLNYIYPDGEDLQVYWIQPSDYSIVSCPNGYEVQLRKAGTVTLTANCSNNVTIKFTLEIKDKLQSSATTTTTSTTTSTTTTVPTTTTPPVTEPPYILGDVNDDGSVDASDASLVLAEYAKVQTGGNPTFTESQTNAADVNKDDVIDASDASKILAYYAAISTGKEPTWD